MSFGSELRAAPGFIDPAVKAEWAQQGATPMVMSPAQFQQYLEGDIAKWARVIKAANIKVD